MHWQFGEMEFGEMKRNTSNWCNFCMLLRRAGLTASAGLSCINNYKTRKDGTPPSTFRFGIKMFRIFSSKIKSKLSGHWIIGLGDAINFKGRTTQN